MSLGSNGFNRVRLLRKIPSRLRGTIFCTSSARFAPSFVWQWNGPKCTKIVWNVLNHEFRVQWDGSGAFVAPSFVRQPNGTKCTQIVRNTPKHEFRSQWGESVVFVAKNYDATSLHELLNHFDLFCTEFCKATTPCQASKEYKTHQNMSFESNGLDRVCSLWKIPNRLQGTNFCTSLSRFAPSFVRRPNGTKCTQIVRNEP